MAVAPTQREVYVRDLSTETTTLVSRASSATGIYADKEASNAGLSSDGTVVAFLTRATNLDPGVSGKGDVFVRNLATNTTTLASRGNGAAGPFSNNSSHGGSLSADGNRVAFTNRAPGTLTSTPKGDVYVRDLAAATTTLVSVGAGDGEAVYPSISGNGDCVAFYAYDRGLTASDPERSDFSRIFMGTVSRECPIDPPDTAISAGPKTLSNLRTPTFSLASADATAHFECRLDGAAFAVCAESLSDGSHAFEARAVDPAGYVDATPAAFAWTIDATGPRLAVTVPRQRLRTVRKRGLRIVVGCSEKCTIATNLKHGRRVVGTARGAATAARKTTLYVKLTKRERRALTHRRRVTLKLSTNAADGLGNRAKTDVRNLKLKR